ncbi:MAG: oligosaccharide flippase family protein [Pseudonocardiaceae bacterium]
MAIPVRTRRISSSRASGTGDHIVATGHTEEHLIGDASGLTSNRRDFLRATKWSFIARAGGQSASLVIGVALAALIGPESYGIVVMALAYIQAFEVLQRQGIVDALIQRRDLNHEHASTAFWLVLAVSLLMTVVSAALAGWWSGVVDLPLLQPVIIALSGMLPLMALIVVQEALLSRRMEFKKLTLRTSVGVLVGGAAAVTVAVVEPSVWALVVYQLTSNLVSVLFLWGSSSWRPRLSFSFAALRDLLGFSNGSFLTQLALFANNSGDALIIGLFFGPTTVGVYRLAGRLVDAFIGFAIVPLNALVLPELSPFQHRPDLFRERLRRLNRLRGLVALPLLGVAVAAADPVIRVLGPAWSNAVLPLRLLCIIAAIHVVVGLVNMMLEALGRPYLSAGIVSLLAASSVVALMLPALLVGTAPLAQQVVVLALSKVALLGPVFLLSHFVIIRRFVNVSIRSWLAVFVAPAIAGGMAIMTGVGVTWVADAHGWALAVHIPMVVVASVIVAGTVLVTLDRQLQRELWQLVQRRSLA